MTADAGFTPSQAQAYEAMSSSVVAFELQRDTMALFGPQASAYLQGQLSQDIDALEVDVPAASLLLSPQGKLVAWIRVTKRSHDSFVIDVDGGAGQAVKERLLKFKLRTKIEIEDMAWKCIALRGPQSHQRAAQLSGLSENGEVVVLPLTWGALQGVDMLGPQVSLPNTIVLADHQVAESIRVEFGIPKMGAELDDRTIPAEAGIVDDSVSFTKGCYTGQELVARIDSRGSNVPKKLHGLIMQDQVASPGASITLDGKVVGTITSAAWSGRLQRAIALGYVKRGVEVGSAVQVSWGEVTTSGRVTALPIPPT